MSIRIKRLAGAVLSLSILVLAHGANAQTPKAMIGEALDLLSSAVQTLQQDSLSPGDKQRALSQIHGAAEILMRVQAN
ncbi:MAG TPA: hypothetical protein VGG57_13900 [Stellaceae bacterium]